MKLAASLALFLSLSGVFPASGRGVDNRILGLRALDEGNAALACIYLGRALDEKPGDLDLRVHLAKALVESGQPEPAVETLRGLDGRGEPTVAYWRARAYAALERWEWARQAFLLTLRHARDEGLAQAARQGFLVVALQPGASSGMMGRLERELRDSLTPAGDHSSRVLLGQIGLRRGDYEGALEVIAPTLESAAWGRLRHDQLKARILAARAYRALGDPLQSSAMAQRALIDHGRLTNGDLLTMCRIMVDANLTTENAAEAERVLLTIVRQARQDERWRIPLVELSRLYQASGLEAAASLSAFIAAEADAPQRPYCMLIVARQELRRTDSMARMRGAEELLRQLVEEYESHPLFPLAALELMQVRLQLGNPSGALAVWETIDPGDEGFSRWAAPLRFLAAQSRFALGRFDEAAKDFASISSSTNEDDNGELGIRALYNQEVARLTKDAAVELLPATRWQDQSAETDFSALTDRLVLNQATALAQQRRLEQVPVVLAQLETVEAPTLSDEGEQSPVRVEAELLKAETAFSEGNPGKAREILAELDKGTGIREGDLRMRADYLHFWMAAFSHEERLEGADREGEGVAGSEESLQPLVERARKFLEDYPDTLYAERIWFKLGELYFNAGYYVDAQQEFERLSKSAQDRTLVQAAVYQAAVAAERTLTERGRRRALELFERVSILPGPLRVQAFLDQGDLLTEMGQLSDALSVYRALMVDENVTEVQRLLAYQRIAQTCYAMSGAAEEPRDAQYRAEQALEALEAILDSPEATLELRNFAHYLSGRLKEQAGQAGEALVAFDQGQIFSEPGSAPEYLWSYRCGFAAAELLASQDQARSAVSILEEMARRPAPLAPQAAQQAQNLREEFGVVDSAAGD